MTPIEKEVLEEVFDSLDRLFDRQTSVEDVYAIVLISSKVVTEIDLSIYATQLKNILRAGAGEETKREQALEVTDDLRSRLNDLLPV